MSEDIKPCSSFENGVLLNGNDTGENGKSVPPLSKKALKRLKKQEKWDLNKPIKRAQEKAKRKEKKKATRLLYQQLGLLKPSKTALKNNLMSRSSCKLRVVLDFSFDHLMSNKDLKKCAAQFNFMYSSNRKCANPLQFYATSFGGKSKQALTNRNGYDKWDVNIRSESYMDLFKKEELIYLTRDSENVITSLDESKVYIIGAIVDHNGHKGLTYNIAKEQGIGHGRLPISEFVRMKSRHVLAACHVFDILVEVGSNGLSWKEAFYKCIPLRRNVREKEESEANESNNEVVENKEAA